jgi:hypothetical protein
MTEITEGMLVTYKAHPDWGPGLVLWTLGDRACAGFETPDGPYMDEFALGELEPAKQLEAA